MHEQERRNCVSGGRPMEELPHPVIVEILSRLADSTDLARCRLASRTLRALSCDVRSVRVLCSRDRFLRSRMPATRPLTLPFTSLVANLVALLAPAAALESLSLAAPAAADDDDDDDARLVGDDDDLHLTAVGFLSQWLPLVALRLRNLSISDFWVQSCWRISEALSLICDLCGNLLTLKIRNASLSVRGLKPMQKLTSLTLEHIRLVDTDLEMLNACFFSLKVLNLINVGGFKNPRIHLAQLRICRWTVSNVPVSLMINAPNLAELKLKCGQPETISLETPLLAKLDLSIRKSKGVIKAGKFSNLKSLRIVSSDVFSLAHVFADCANIKKLELDVQEYEPSTDSMEPRDIDLANAFANVDELILGSRFWLMVPECIHIIGEWRGLKKLMLYMPEGGRYLPILFEKLSTFIMHSACCSVLMLIPAAADPDIIDSVISKCASMFPDVAWKWDTSSSGDLEFEFF